MQTEKTFEETRPGSEPATGTFPFRLAAAVCATALIALGAQFVGIRLLTGPGNPWLVPILFGINAVTIALLPAWAAHRAARADRRRRETESALHRSDAQDARFRLVTLEQRVADRTAELSASNRELEAFAYSVSHDLRAPLRTIDGFSRILVEEHGDRLDETAREHLERVRKATHRMGQLIDDLLTLSRLARAELRREPADLSELAGEICDELRAREPHRAVDVAIAPALEAECDPKLIRIVLENLLGNAWKFTSRHPVARIEIGTQEDHPDRPFFVRDDGAGFDMAYADRLFSPFQRLHGITEFEGNGVGLATVQRILHRHGGRIWADAQPERGATFYFTLPRLDADSRARAEGPSIVVEARSSA